MVGVTGQVQQVASSIVQRVRQRDGPGHKPGIRTGCRTDTGPRTNTTPRQSLQVWP
ncbi:unnamed protein product, partial [Staurois parvus]